MFNIFSADTTFILGTIAFIVFFVYDIFDRIRSIREFNAFGTKGHLVPYLRIKRPVDAFYAVFVIVLEIGMISFLIFLTLLHFHLL